MKKVLLTATLQSHICQFHRPLAALLHENGCELHVAAKNNLDEKNGLRLDFADRVFDVPFSRSPKSPDNLRAYRQLKQIIDAGDYDFIHCNTPVGGVVTRLAARQARKRGTTVIYCAHGFHFYRGAPRTGWLLYYPVERWMARLTDRLITIVGEDEQLARQRFSCPVYRIHGVGVDARRYYPAAPEERAALRREFGFSDTQRVLLCIGELRKNKNQSMAIRAMEQITRTYPDALLLLAGNGPEREALERQIADAHMENNVRLLGYVTDLERYQRAADLLVACSYREGLGLNVIEAMMSGNPAVLSDNRGHRELYDGGRAGILVPPDDASAMAAAVTGILGDDEQYAALSAHAQTFSAQYSFDAVKRELAAVYGF